MIFFRKKKPEPSPPAKKQVAEPAKKAKAEHAPAPKPSKLQEIAHTRVLTAEGWRRLMKQKVPKKGK